MHVSRWGAFRAVAFSFVLGSFLGCGGEDPESTAPLDPAADGAETDADDAQSDDGAAGDGEFDVSLTGHDIPMTARAELKVNEGERPVHLSITGRTSGADVIVIDLTFDGIENAMGAHAVEFSLPESGLHVANGSLEGSWYYSQGGTIEVSLTPEGEMVGEFSIALARGEMGDDPGEPVVYAPSAESTLLEGAFDVPWTLNCHSRLEGHSAFKYGGEWCDELEF